jgi:hypothetical protein
MKASSSAAALVSRLTAVAFVCLVAVPVSAFAQKAPLAEVARKEAERRKGIKEAQKVITAKDLPESARKPVQRPATPSSAHGGEATPAAPGAAAAPTTTEKPADSIAAAQRDESHWRTRITQAREQLRRGEAFLAALQSQVNGLTTDFVNRDDPYQRAQIGEQRQKALAELERVKADIELSRKLIADIEEEARKAGVPPGYLR